MTSTGEKNVQKNDTPQLRQKRPMYPQIRKPNRLPPYRRCGIPKQHHHQHRRRRRNQFHHVAGQMSAKHSHRHRHRPCTHKHRHRFQCCLSRMYGRSHRLHHHWHHYGKTRRFHLHQSKCHRHSARMSIILRYRPTATRHHRCQSTTLILRRRCRSRPRLMCTCLNRLLLLRRCRSRLLRAKPCRNPPILPSTCQAWMHCGIQQSKHPSYSQ